MSSGIPPVDDVYLSLHLESKEWISTCRVCLARPGSRRALPTNVNPLFGRVSSAIFHCRTCTELAPIFHNTNRESLKTCCSHRAELE
jgi:hypothetical protein